MMSFCRAGLKASVEIARPTDLLAMIIGPALAMRLEALEICELDS
jgi:hypothetical protein